MTRRVVVTGTGIVAPVGNDTESAWENVVNGRSGISPIPVSEFDASKFSTRFGGCIKNFDPTEYVSAKDVRRIDPFMVYGIAAAREAIDNSGLEFDETNVDRIGVAIGSGIGGIGTIQTNCENYLAGGPRKISPFFIPGSIINMVSGHVSIQFGLRGPNLGLATACATSTHSIGIAARAITHGDADVMLAGGSEYATTALGIGGCCAARALSTRNDDPESASRPWDAGRDGFVLSNGAGCLVLEELECARKRGANIMAEVAGFGMSADAHHITAPAEDGIGARLCMAAVLKDAGLKAEEVDYINAHGTSTQLGDISETRAIRDLFGNHADRLAVSSTKSTTGHLLGAAGAVEAIFSVLSLRDQVAPPTINLDTPDPDCDLDYVPNEAREMTIRAVLTNSFGFGGTNGSLIFKTFDS